MTSATKQRTEWFSRIPSGWRAMASKRLGRITNGATPASGEAENWDGEIVWVTPDDLGSLTNRDLMDSSRQITRAGYRNCGTTLVPSGSILLSTRAPIGHVAIARVDACFNQGCRALTLHAEHCSEYFYYQLIAAKEELSSLGTGTTFRELSRDRFAALRLLVPPPSEQRAIADFLDRETAKIDDLIAKQRALIVILRERVEEITAKCLTRGLSATATYKQSGLPWIGDTPNHWTIERAKFLFHEINDPPRDEDRVVTAFRDGQVTLRDNRRSDGFTFAELEVGYQHVSVGDLVIHSMDAFAGAIGVSESDGKCTGEYVVCRSIDGRHNHYFFSFLLRFMAKRGFIFVLCPSVRERAPRFRFVRFKETRLPVPPRREQDEIVKYIEERTANVQELISRAKSTIAVLQERRSALITAAVTGQTDLRDKAVVTEAAD